MPRKKQKIETGSAPTPFAGENPFTGLDPGALPTGTPPPAPKDKPSPRKPGLRVEIRREKSGRGGKTVTTLRGLATLDSHSSERLFKNLKTSLGTGGAVIADGFLLQGDCRDKVEEILRERGFQPVRSGG